MRSQACILDLPSHIIVEILSHLPVKTIIRCKSVCKTWLKLLIESEFAKFHLSKAHPSILINHHHACDSASLEIVDYVGKPEPGLDYFEMELTFGLERPEAVLIGSINGLVCLNDICEYFDKLYILNPITREYLALPPAEGLRKYPNLVAYGFGISARTTQYKVVRIFQEMIGSSSHCKSEGQVYTLGSGSWRSVDHVFLSFGCRLHGVNLNGCLHWLVNDREQVQSICSFDLDDESFFPVPPPPGLSFETTQSLGTLRGCLCVCNYASDTDMNIWVMKEYGVKESWSKEILISIPLVPSLSDYSIVYALESFPDGEVLMQEFDHLLFLYNPETKTRRELNISNPSFEAKIHVSSFLSLKNFLNENVQTF